MSTTKNELTKYTDFATMGLSEQLLRGVYAYGFEKPSAIQQQAIVPMTQGRDVVAQAQSGTGKTGAFTIGLLQCLDLNEKSTQALILAPTRELAEQIKTVIMALSAYMSIGVILCVGGVPLRVNMTDLRNKPHVVVATTGRACDLIERKALDMSRLRVIVLDEADQMLSSDFEEQVHKIFENVPMQAQFAIFSATYTLESLKVAKAMESKDRLPPLEILVKSEELTLDGIAQFFVSVEKESWKSGVIQDLYDVASIQQCIIYCNTKERTIALSKFLSEEGFTVAFIHGDMSQDERNSCMKDFRDGKCRVLISTDLLARGIDVQTVSMVINYDIPTDIPSYIHRIGRSGRFGRKGVAINLVTPDNVTNLRDIEKYYHTVIKEMPTNISDFIPK